MIHRSPLSGFILNSVPNQCNLILMLPNSSPSGFPIIALHLGSIGWARGERREPAGAHELPADPRAHCSGLTLIAATNLILPLARSISADFDTSAHTAGPLLARSSYFLSPYRYTHQLYLVLELAHCHRASTATLLLESVNASGAGAHPTALRISRCQCTLHSLFVSLVSCALSTKLTHSALLRLA